MTCQIYDAVIKRNKKVNNLSKELRESLINADCHSQDGNCFSCVYHIYHKTEEGSEVDILMDKLRKHRILGRITSRGADSTFHIGFNGIVYHLTLRKISFDLYDEIERGLR